MQPNIEKRNKRIALLNSDEFKNRIAEEKNADPKITFLALSKRFSEEYDMNITATQLSDVYTNELSMELTREGPVEKQLNPFLKKIYSRFEKLEKTTEKYHNMVDRTVDNLADVDDAELAVKIKDVLQAGKQVELVNKMTITQIQLIQSEQDKLKVTSTKGIKTDAEVRERVNKYFKDILVVLEKQGKIVINDKNLIK